MRVDQYDAVVEAALAEARAAGLFVIVRIQDTVERRLVLQNGAVERQRTSSLAGLGLHAFGPDGSVGFASVDDVRPEAARAAVRRAGLMARAAQQVDGARSLAPFALASAGRGRVEMQLPGGAAAITSAWTPFRR